VAALVLPGPSVCMALYFPLELNFNSFENYEVDLVYEHDPWKHARHATTLVNEEKQETVQVAWSRYLPPVPPPVSDFFLKDFPPAGTQYDRNFLLKYGCYTTPSVQEVGSQELEDIRSNITKITSIVRCIALALGLHTAVAADENDTSGAEDLEYLFDADYNTILPNDCETIYEDDCRLELLMDTIQNSQGLIDAQNSSLATLKGVIDNMSKTLFVVTPPTPTHHAYPSVKSASGIQENVSSYILSEEGCVTCARRVQHETMRVDPLTTPATLSVQIRDSDKQSDVRKIGQDYFTELQRNIASHVFAVELHRELMTRSEKRQEVAKDHEDKFDNECAPVYSSDSCYESEESHDYDFDGFTCMHCGATHERLLSNCLKCFAPFA
jgi:hypothetical protein